MSGFELDENELTITVWTNYAPGAEEHVEIWHHPTGLTARASDVSRIKARREALADLTERVRQVEAGGLP